MFCNIASKTLQELKPVEYILKKKKKPVEYHFRRILYHAIHAAHSKIPNTTAIFGTNATFFFFCEKIPTPPGRVPCAEHLTQISPNPENGKKTKPPAPQCRPLERHRDGKSAKAYYSDAASSPALMQHLWKQNTHILSSCRTEIAGSPPTPTARAEDGKDGDP